MEPDPGPTIFLDPDPHKKTVGSATLFVSPLKKGTTLDFLSPLKCEVGEKITCL